MSFAQVARHRTAIRRLELSRPMRIALEDGLIRQDTLVLDYGSGHGDDIRHLSSLGIRCFGWDPVHNPQGQRITADVVNLGYVINVIENPEERASALREAWDLTRTALIVSARLSTETKEDKLTPYGDGWLTRSGTFQRYYEQRELRDWIDQALRLSSVAAAPGIFYVFRDSDVKQSFVASRFRRRADPPHQRKSDRTFEENRELLEPLTEFIASRGRLPDATELDVVSTIRMRLGSLQRAFGVIRRACWSEQWDRIREERSQDLLVYLGLARFGGRPTFSQLPQDLQLDIRAFFSTYSRACSLADALLFSAGKQGVIDEACRASPIGKLTLEALYVHQTGLAHLAPVLRVYEGCARALTGAVEGANVIKLRRDKSQVSYLSYPGFERTPHPCLAAHLTVNLRTLKLRYREYEEHGNPPVLHRKETFLPLDHPLQKKFARLTRQEERWGLYQDTQIIGTRSGWEEVLEARGARLVGHRLLRSRSS